MARGQPDYGMYAVKEVAASISDMGEVAARLGSIDIYDKRGDVVFFDNFEDLVLGWTIAPVGVGSYARFDSASPKSGSQGVRLHTPNLAGAEVNLYSGFPLVTSTRVGAEITFADLDTDLDFYLAMSFYTGTRVRIAEVRLDPSARKLHVRDDTGAYVEIGDTGLLYKAPFGFHTIKLVADFTAIAYKRLLFDAVEYDISSHELQDIASPLAAGVVPNFLIKNRAAVGGDGWVDDFILTQEEP